MVKILTPAGIGSGVVIDENGNILTNWHILRVDPNNGHMLYETAGVAFIDGQTLLGIVVGYNEQLDLLILRTSRTNGPYLEPVDCSIEPGDDILVFGYPDAIESMDNGIVGGFRNIRGLTRVKTNALISPGTSGGAVVNLEGDLCGIASWRSEDGHSGFFTDVSKAKEEISLLKDGKKLEFEP